jgi:hypothetical protein
MKLGSDTPVALEGFDEYLRRWVCSLSNGTGLVLAQDEDQEGIAL